MIKVPFDEVPKRVLQIVTAKGGIDHGSVVLNEERDIAYRTYEGVFLPCVLFHNGRVEIVESPPSRKQDSGDLFEYDYIAFLAREGMSKDKRTCRWVKTIHEQFIERLLALPYFAMSVEPIHVRRGMIEQAKFTVARIWKAGENA